MAVCMKRRQSHEFPEPCGYLGSVGGGDEDMAVEEEEHRVPMSVVSNNTRGLESPICGPPEAKRNRMTPVRESYLCEIGTPQRLVANHCASYPPPSGPPRGMTLVEYSRELSAYAGSVISEATSKRDRADDSMGGEWVAAKRPSGADPFSRAVGQLSADISRAEEDASAGQGRNSYIAACRRFVATQGRTSPDELKGLDQSGARIYLNLPGVA